MENLRIIREKRHKSQLNVALAVGVTQEAISTYESGTSYPKVQVLIKLAKYLGTSTDYLLGLTDNESPIKYINNNLDEKQKELLNKFLYLKVEDQMKLVGYMDSLIKVSN